MPITIKTAAMKYKDAHGRYIGVDAVAETTTSAQVAALEAAGAEQIAAIEAMETGAIEVSGATPTITAQAGRRYVCTAAAVEELSLTPPAEGVFSVKFVSGTTPTVISGLNNVTMPDWWAGCEASRTYLLMVIDGAVGVVTSWS